MRILVAHQVLRARTGGMSRIMGFIHDQIAAAGHEVEYLCSDDLPQYDTTLGRRLLFPIAVRRHAITAAREGRPYDIVNVHEPSAAPVAMWKRRAGSPAVVVTSHGLERRAWELAKEEANSGREGPALTTRLTYVVTGLWPAEFALRRADHIFCLNFEDRDYLVRQFGRSMETVTRIYPAADLVYARAAEGRDYARAERILFAGTWRKNKGVEDLVPAFVGLARRHPTLSLVVIGAGVPEQDIRAQFPACLQSRITCETPADEAAMAVAFARTDVFLLPSLFEGTPLTLIQAMMSGLPIVTTETCGMKDVIRRGDNGLLVSIRRPDAIISAVQNLVTDRALRERLGRAAHADAIEHYTWDRVAEPVGKVYENLWERQLQRKRALSAEYI